LRRGRLRDRAAQEDCAAENEETHCRIPNPESGNGGTGSLIFFGHVVDNYGDGRLVALARHSSSGTAAGTPLADDFTVLKLRPEIDPAYDIARLEGVEVGACASRSSRRGGGRRVVRPGCGDPPESYVLAMAARAARPR
jgi:hypothetical protein